jgi:hypothetical protein
MIGGADDENGDVRSGPGALASIAEVNEYEGEQGEHCHLEKEGSSSQYLDSRDSSFIYSLRSQSSLSTTTHVEPWLSELFSNNLKKAVAGEIFAGGADEGLLLTEDHCPLCGVPLHPSDPHLLKCQYSHDEKERLEKSVRRFRKVNEGF